MFRTASFKGNTAPLIPIKKCYTEEVQTQIISAPPESYWAKHGRNSTIRVEYVPVQCQTTVQGADRLR